MKLTHRLDDGWRRTCTVFAASALLVGAGFALLVGISGCEETSTPPQAGGLSQNPTSTLGRSAKTAKDIAAQAENRQAQASDAADAISGQVGGMTMSGLTWSVPSAWRKVEPASNFIAAEYRIDGDGGEARMTVSKFAGGAGGSIDQNVARWEAQFRDDTGGSVVAHPTKRSIAGCNVTLVTISGTFKGGVQGAAATDTPDTEMRGALIEGPEGLVVIKLTGPKETVEQVGAEWDQMIQGMAKAGK
jgi:hypothetical protein